MKKKSGCSHRKTAAPLMLLSCLPLLANAADRFVVPDTTLTFDNMLRNSALLQQSLSPLARLHHSPTTGRESVSDPDAIYVQYGQDDAEQAGIDSEGDYTLRSQQMITGGDYQLTPEWTVGANIGQIEQTLRFTDYDDSNKQEADLASVNALWFKNGFTAGAMLGYVNGELESLRIDDSTGNSARAEADSEQQLLSVAGRYEFHEGAWVYGPLSRLDLSRGEIDAHEELAAIATTQWQRRETETRVFSMGVHGAYVFDLSRGTLTPYATLTTRKEFHYKRDPLQSVTVSDDVTREDFVTAVSWDERWHELTCGLHLSLDKQLLLTAELEKAMDLHHQDQESLSIKADWIFQGI